MTIVSGQSKRGSSSEARTPLIISGPSEVSTDKYYKSNKVIPHLIRGEVISRTTLFDHIFDENSDPNSNLLDVHVSSIRKKIGHDVILTRRGQGFYVEE